MIIEVDRRVAIGSEAIEEIRKISSPTMSNFFYQIEHVLFLKEELVEQADLDFQGNVARTHMITSTGFEDDRSANVKKSSFSSGTRNLGHMKTSVQLGLNE